MNGSFEILLAFGRKFVGVVPRLLIAHAAAGEDGDLEVRFSEAAVEHDVNSNKCANRALLPFWLFAALFFFLLRSFLLRPSQHFIHLLRFPLARGSFLWRAVHRR